MTQIILNSKGRKIFSVRVLHIMYLRRRYVYFSNHVLLELILLNSHANEKAMSYYTDSKGKGPRF